MSDKSIEFEELVFCEMDGEFSIFYDECDFLTIDNLKESEKLVINKLFDILAQLKIIKENKGKSERMVQVEREIANVGKFMQQELQRLNKLKDELDRLKQDCNDD